MHTQQQTYQEEMEAQLNAYSARIAAVKAKAQQANARAKIAYYDQLEDLRIKENAVIQKLGTLKEAGDAAPEELRAAAEAALNSLCEALAQD